MSIDDLFKNTNSPNGTGGIYSFSKSVDADGANPQLWERPASIEMIDRVSVACAENPMVSGAGSAA